MSNLLTTQHMASKFRYVGQNIFLFDDTIKNNICFTGNDNTR